MKIGIRREDKNPWEIRVPLIPEDVRKLVAEHGLKIQIQPSDARVFPDSLYLEAGAEVNEDLSSCLIVMGVKEIPEACFEPGKTYVFFSHTIKGQSYNMAMLRRMMDLECNLLDYETITDDQGRRLVFFGRFAGLAGMIDSLWSLGQRWLVEGLHTPLAEVKQTHNYSSLDDAREKIAAIATRVATDSAIKSCGPIVCGFAGYGAVSKGAQEIFDIFKPTTLAPQDLATANLEDGRFYKVVFKEEHLVEPIDSSQPFELQDYYDQPEKYRSVFEQYVPYLTVLINGIYWEAKYPRLLTTKYIKSLYAGGQPSLKVIGDISCDPEGSIEFLLKTTDPGNPCYVYNIENGVAVDGLEGNGPVMMAVDILPTELPREASTAFSKALTGLLPELAAADSKGTFDEWALPGPLKRAAILHKGKLTENYAYIEEFLK